jgi:hypothetical protein
VTVSSYTQNVFKIFIQLHDYHIRWYCSRRLFVTRRVPLVEQELLSLSKHLIFSPVFSCSFFSFLCSVELTCYVFWPLYCLSFKLLYYHLCIFNLSLLFLVMCTYDLQICWRWRPQIMKRITSVYIINNKYYICVKNFIRSECYIYAL